MQTCQWAWAYPEMVKRIRPVISAGDASPWLIAWLNVWATPVRMDPAWKNGNYYESGQPVSYTHLDVYKRQMLTSKGASGITGAGFITLAATLAVVDPRLVPGMAIVLGIDKFLSECRALTNLTGNGIATVIVAWWEGELDHEKLKAGLNKQIDPSDIETAVTTGCCLLYTARCV